MLQRIVHAALVLITLIGVVHFLRGQQMHRSLRRERDRLAGVYGYMSVDDPNLYYVERVQQPEQGHYLWRVHVPADGQLVVKDRLLNSSGSGNIEHADHQALIRLHIGPRHGAIRCYLKTHRSASYGRFAHPEELSDFLWRHWDQLEIQVTDRGDRFAGDMSDPITLLSIQVPEHLIDDAVDSVPERQRSRLREQLSKPIVEIVCGTEAAFAQQE